MPLRRNFRQTKLFRALIVFGFLLLLVIFPPRFLFEPFQELFITVSRPFQSFFSAMAYGVRGSVSFLVSIGELKGENERLQAERIVLLGENAHLREQAKENETLRGELGLLPRETFDLAATEVIGRGGALGEGLVLINQGARHGLRKNMPVIVGKGILVGKISETFPYHATVTLLTHPASFVNGATEKNGAKGIIKGEHGLGLLFDIVLQSDPLASGETVVTSGLDPDIPRGLLVGTLQGPELTADRLYQRASLVPPVKYEDLRYIFVIKNFGTP